MTSPLSSAAVNPEASAADVSRKELQDKLNGLGGLSGRKLDPEAKAKKLREACEGFESIFIQKMWQEMRNAVPKGGLLQGREEKFWQDMYDQELSKSMTKAGGIGLADMMYAQLSRNLVSASRSTAGLGGAGAFVPEAAPLLGQVEAEDPWADAEAAEAPAQPKAPMGSIYDGEAPQVAEGVEERAEPVAQPVAPAAAPLATPAPLERVVEQNATDKTAVVANAEKAAPKRTPRVKRTGLNGGQYENNGLNLAYLAKREAGDKLGSGAVRPALHPRKEEASHAAETEAVQTEGALITQSGQFVPGSTAGLRAALELARSGKPDAAESAQPNLQNIVASLQAQNSAVAAREASASVSGPENAGAVEAVTRKVRYTTNIPKSSKAKKKAEQAIRTLNVDSAGPNSKQGQGFAAYHASQQGAAQPVTNAQAVEQPAAAPIAPLTAVSAQGAEAPAGNFAIPPLRGDGLKS